MPPGRPRDNAKHLNAAVSDLATALTGLVKALGQRAPATQVVVRAGKVAAAARAKGRHRGRKAKVGGRSKGGSGPGKANPVHIAALRGAWARYTPAQRKARIAAMKAGHAKRKQALAQKGAAKAAGKVAKQRARTKPAHAARKIAKQPSPKRAAAPKSTHPKPAPAARKSPWASMSPERRAERIAKMKAGRKGAPVQTPAVT